MAALSFNDAITRLSQQKQALSGRAPSRNELAGVAEGVAADADERLSRSKQLDIQQQAQNLDVQRLAEEKRLADTELQFAHDASLRDIKANRAETATSIGGTVGGAVGTYYGGAVGGAAGSAVGSMLGKIASGNSWICSALHTKEPWKLSQQKALLKLFKYSHGAHPEQFKHYQEIGPELAKHGIREDVLKIIGIVQTGKLEQAYQEYYTMCENILKKNIPYLLERAA